MQLKGQPRLAFCCLVLPVTAPRYGRPAPNENQSPGRLDQENVLQPLRCTRKSLQQHSLSRSQDRQQTLPFFMKHVLFCLAVSLIAFVGAAQDSSAVRSSEIIYGRKDGTALTLTLLQPRRPVGRGIVSIVSGNWRSSYSQLPRTVNAVKPYLASGYTVFLVVHGSQPRYAIPDAVADVRRAVQFIRYHAEEYGIDAERLGITGASSGGHLSLMAGLSDDAANPKAPDFVARMSSKVQAVACFFPPTDFLNWGGQDLNPVRMKPLLARMGVAGAFAFTSFDSTKNIYVEVSSDSAMVHIAKSVSPAQLATADDAPVFIWHGDADAVVPLQQSQRLKQQLEAAGVPVTLKVKPGGKHGWAGMWNEESDFIRFFDEVLKVKR